MSTRGQLVGLFAVILAGCTLTAQCVILHSVWEEEDQKTAGTTFAEYGSLALIVGVIVTGVLAYYAHRSREGRQWANVAGVVTVLAVAVYFVSGVIAYNAPDEERRQQELRWKQERVTRVQVWSTIRRSGPGSGDSSSIRFPLTG